MADYPKLLLEFKNERTREQPTKRYFNVWLKRKGIRELAEAIRACDIRDVTNYDEAEAYLQALGCDICKGLGSPFTVEQQPLKLSECPYCGGHKEKEELKFNACLHPESGYTVA